ncbi:MAG: IS5 family transposase [Pseudomonadales bacterium]|nr:IS5 family transposase [Pseudomonadales bacterium]
MPRLMLSDELWLKLKLILLQFGVYDKRSLRMTVEGMLYRMRTGLPWRDLPDYFGHWNSVYKKFNAWSAKGIWSKVFEFFVVEPDLEWGFIDGSYVKAHQHSSGAAAAGDQAIGRSRAGYTSKIHMVVDGFGLPVHFEITGGQTHDSSAADDVLEGADLFEYVIGDKGYDKEPLRQKIRDRGSIPMIPRRRNSTVGNDDMDWGLYKNRHLVENQFARLKHYRAVATRYDKLKRNFESVVAMACAIQWLPM